MTFTDNGAPRRILLALVAFGALGLLIELILLEHYDGPWQWTPLVLLAMVLIACAVVAWRPSRAALAGFRSVMALCVAAGMLGTALHYKGNVEFELEHDPSLRGRALVWETLRGATPALAPGALAQLGLLGLVFAWRHPALRKGATVDHLHTESR